MVVGNLQDAERRTGRALATGPRALRMAHARRAARGRDMAGDLAQVFQRAGRRPPSDVDEDLYGGFRRQRRPAPARTRCAHAAEQLAARAPFRRSPRCTELLFRYRARNFPETLERAGAAALGRTPRGAPVRGRRRRAHDRSAASSEIDAAVRGRPTSAARRSSARCTTTRNRSRRPDRLDRIARLQHHQVGVAAGARP